ncbi:histone H1/H5 family protein [Striga asiatica]|uniref:Histone H1/H5 family protein n=1 Tax=Striga asiatica TaxID=4170 RepID=A0A5A7QI97_STRAF|nr:histone H1/H5 family protein [Striga asiatica]
MDCPIPLNPKSKTLVQNPKNHSTQRKAMENFRNIVFKLAESHPNAALTPSAKNLILERLDRFVSQYKTPDHPPYSAMIERAIRELNEKRGSSEDSISNFLVKEYDNLPWAHPSVLKHHLKTLCKSGDIIITNKKRYKLPGKTEIPVINSQRMEKKVERKPPRSKKRLKWDWERVKKKRLNRKPVLKLKINLRGKKIEAIAENQERKRVSEENVGNVASSADVDLNSNSQQQTVGPTEIIEPGASCTSTHEHPDPVDLNSRQQTEKNFDSQQQGIGSSEIMGPDDHQPELEKPNDLNSRQKTQKKFDSQQHRIGQLEITKPDASSACTDVQPELQKPEDLNFQQQAAIGRPEITDPSAASDPAQLENMSDLGLARVGPNSSEELLISDRARRQQRRWSMCPRERKSLVAMNSMELMTCQNQEENLSLDSSQLIISMQKDHESKVKSNGENASSALTDEQPELQKPEDLDLNSQQLAIGPPEVTEPEATVCMQSKHIGPEILGPPGPEQARLDYPPNLGPESKELVDSERARRQQRRWNMSRPEKKATSMELVISQNPDENNSPGSNLASVSEPKDEENNVKSKGGKKYNRKRKPDLLTLPILTNQEVPAQQDAIFQKEPRRSLRLRLAKPEVTNDANVVLALPSQDLGEKVEEGLLSEPLNKMPVNGLDEEKKMLMSLTDRSLTAAVGPINCTGLGGVPKHRPRGRLARSNAGLTQAA